MTKHMEQGCEFDSMAENLLPCHTALDWLKKRTTDNDKDDDEYTFIKHAIKAYAAQQPIDAWLPIEMAPRDGSWILTAQDGEVRANCWFNFDVTNVFNSDEYKKWFSQDKPTHWMPLPKPPEDR